MYSHSLLKPPHLRPGSRLATVTLSWGGPGAMPHRYDAGVRQLEAEFGVEVVEMPHVRRDPDWIYAHPRARADDLMQAFADPSIDGIISTIGGSESVRLLPYLDLDIIRRNPKVFCGYSDTTVAHLACFRAGLVSFYGPSIMSGFGESGGMHRYMVDAVRRTMFNPDPPGEWLPNPDGWTVEHMPWEDPANQAKPRALQPPLPWRWLQGSGIRQGHLMGGCIEALEFLKGTDWWPPLDQWTGAVLFLETSEDAPTPQYVEYWLRNYGSQGILQRLAAILVGRPGGCVAVETFSDYDAVLQRVVTEELGLADLPIITCLDFGHTDPMFVLPYGISAEIDCDHHSIRFLESGVV